MTNRIECKICQQTGGICDNCLYFNDTKDKCTLLNKEKFPHNSCKYYKCGIKEHLRKNV